MAEHIRIENFPDSGSVEAVALSLWRHLRNKAESADVQLDAYVDCLLAVRGFRAKDRS